MLKNENKYVNSSLNNNMKKAYKYRGGIGVFDQEGHSIFERDVNTLVNNQIYLPTVDLLNDPTEGFYNDFDITSLLDVFKDYSQNVKKQYAEFLDKLTQKGVYSLSNNINNELLWAYYGSGHTGFAIEYDIDVLKKSLNHNQYFQFIYDFDVDYKKSIPNADISILSGKNKDVTPVLKVFLGTKSLSWKHEEEYRLIVEEKGLFDIDYRAVTGIYFGCRMQDSEINFIMEKLKGRDYRYYKMRLVEQTYKFQPESIDDKYIDTPKYHANELTYDIDELLLPEDILGKEAYAYKDRLVEALEIVKHEPLINKIYIANISIESGNPIFIIWAYTNTKAPPVKEFRFGLDKNGVLVRMKN